MADLVGRRLGRYEVRSLLGSGGMGVVYRGRDTELGRDVAIKVLADKALEDDRRLARFRQEAKAVASLSHPNILAIHDFGIDDRTVYAVTELLVGKDLRQRLKGRPLPLAKALEIGTAVAEGLAAAHDKGIVHRDIKPENVFVTSDGQVKILDFGIARLKPEADPQDTDQELTTASLTGVGHIVGTVGYMSPEQVKGAPVDERSDIFSLGCLLYELLTGSQAFKHDSPSETIMAILSQDPKPMLDLRPDVPPAVEGLVRRCLEKQPGERYQSARDVAFSLQNLADTRDSQSAAETAPLLARRKRRRWAAVAVAAALILAAMGTLLAWQALLAQPELPTDKHIAVTSFQAGDGDPELQQLAEGLSLFVEAGLVRVGESMSGKVWVAPRPYPEPLSDDPVTHARRKLGASIAVTGRLSRSGDLLRLDLEALHTSSGDRLRHVVIEDNFSNVASFQESPVLEVSGLLGLEVKPDVAQWLADRGTTVPSALDAYLRALAILEHENSAEQVERAIQGLSSAIADDPLFWSGRIALSKAYLSMHEHGPEGDWLDRASQEAQRAIADSPWPSDGYRLLARIRHAQGDVEGGLELLEQATTTSLPTSEAHLELAAEYTRANQLEKAETEIQRALFLRPDYWPNHHALAKLYERAGENEAAAVQYREVVRCAPELTRGHNQLGRLYYFLERRDEARQAFLDSLAIEPSRAAYTNLGTLYFEDAAFADSAAMFEKALEIDDSRYLVWGNLAYAYKFGPAPEKAEEYFRRATELGEEKRKETPDDQWLLTDLAAYYAMLGEKGKGFALLEEVLAGPMEEAWLMASVAEAFEDLGERETALEWVREAFEAGVPRSRFEGSPTLRELVSDDQYKELAADYD